MTAAASAIYLDHNATTPVDPRIAAVVVRAMVEVFGNPNSVEHAFGKAAAALVQDAAIELAALLGADADDVRFTSGASEALRLALSYAEDRHTRAPLKIAASRIEHPALLEALAVGAREGRYTIEWIDPDGCGWVSPAAIAAAIAPGVDLLCLMAANNEVGVIQPIQEATDLAHEVGADILVDATQAAGRIPLQMCADDIDLLVVSAHKMYGPKGVGALVGPGLARAAPPQRLDHHNATLNVAGIAGLGEAARLRRLEMAVDEARIAGLRDRLQSRLLHRLPGLVINGALDRRLAGSLHISIPSAPSDVMLANLWDRVALSSGAACASGVDAPSHVLQAMKLDSWRQETALRFGLGRQTTAGEVDQAAEAVIEVAGRIQSHCKPAA